MLLENRINWKLYLILSVSITFFLLHFWTKSKVEIYVIIATYVATQVNSLLLFKFVGEILFQPLARKKTSKLVAKKMLFLFLKVFILGFSFSIGIHFIGNRIIVPLLNYIIHIFLFILCLKR